MGEYTLRAQNLVIPLAMSLSRILNDEPSPGLSARPAHTAPPLIMSIDPALMSPTSTSGGMSPRPQPPHLPYSDHHGELPPPPRGYAYQALAIQGAGGWDPYNGEWVQGDIFPLGPGGNNYYSERDNQRFMSPPESREPLSAPHCREGEGESTPRKRRKGADDDADYQPPGHRRVSFIHIWISYLDYSQFG